MKQNIDLKQLQEYIELKTDKGKITGFDPIKYATLRKALSIDNSGRAIVANTVTIGKMIEMLGANIIEIDNNGNFWEVATCVNGNIKLFAEKDLCDALWEAVKWHIGGVDNG